MTDTIYGDVSVQPHDYSEFARQMHLRARRDAFNEMPVTQDGSNTLLLVAALAQVLCQIALLAFLLLTHA